MSWYYAKNGRQLGPVDLPELRGQVAAGNLGPEDLVWTAGMQSWTPIREVPEINSPGIPSETVLPSSAYSVNTVSASQTPQPPPPGPRFAESYYQPEYAGFWLRFLAAAVDGIVLLVVYVVIGFLLVGLGSDLRTIENTGRLADIVIAWLYFSLSESSAAQGTVGKRVFLLKVTDLEGNRISFLKATGRHFGKFLSAIILFIGYLMAGFTEKKQALHDILAGCLVVRR